MEICNCIEPQWTADELLMKYQYISDFFIALAYFSIPLELIYFVKKSAVFPYRWVLVQFGAFIVLCGATHLINLWTFSMHSRTMAIVMTAAKVLTAVVSCATALMLVHIIPDLLSVKTRELFLKNKAAELDIEMGLIHTQEDMGRHVRMLTNEIRSTSKKPVAVALSHAAILEELMRARDLPMEQNIALDRARREAETAIHACNDFLAVMNHEMRTPMHAIIALSSSLQETELTPEQRLMVETILKSSNLLATLINDVLDLSRLEDGSLQLQIGTFNLHAVFREVIEGNDNYNSSNKRSKTNEEEGNSSVKAEEEAKNEGDDKQAKNNTKPPEPPKDYIHVRARRGQATDSHSLAERVRREKISERMKLLQDLVPGCNKITGKALMLDEIINYVQSLQRQVEFLSMKLASVNTRLDFNVDALMSRDIYQPNKPLPRPIFQLDSSASASFCHQPQQNAALHSNISNGTMPQGSVPVDPSYNALCRNNLNVHLPQLDQFTGSIPQYPNFCEDELQSIVQMGFGHNPNGEASTQSQRFHGSDQASNLKTEL